MTSNEALTRFMQAHVRMHSSRKPETFTPPELLESFLLLEEPFRSFEDWIKLLGIEMVDPVAANNESASAVLQTLLKGADNVGKPDTGHDEQAKQG